MFEMSLLPQRKGKDARLIRWIGFGSVAVQAVAVTAFIVVPLIHPDTLPPFPRPPKLTHVEFKRPKVEIIPVKPRVQPVVTQATVSMPARSLPAMLETRRSGMMSRAPLSTDIEPVLTLGGGPSMATGFSATSGPGLPTGSGDSPVIVMKPAPAETGPVRVSSGVSKGLLIDPIRPIYPTIAKLTKQQGTVVVTAVIDRTGRIVNAQVSSGPEMLREAAIAAVREARYRPYLLNGQPTEVQTTISITFQIG